MGGIYEYAVQMGSGAMIYIPSFIKTGSGIQKLMEGGGGIHRETDTGTMVTSKAYFYFFKIRKVG
jgi:hypothetical protein